MKSKRTIMTSDPRVRRKSLLFAKLGFNYLRAFRLETNPTAECDPHIRDRTSRSRLTIFHVPPHEDHIAALARLVETVSHRAPVMRAFGQELRVLVSGKQTGGRLTLLLGSSTSTFMPQDEIL
jgi:hypothetical protein